jgi:predicted amidohydrolase
MVFSGRCLCNARNQLRTQNSSQLLHRSAYSIQLPVAARSSSLSPASLSTRTFSTMEFTSSTGEDTSSRHGTSHIFRVAAIQMVSTPRIEENIATARRLIQESVAQGASMVLLPEYWPIFGMKETDKLSFAEEPGSGTIQEFLSDVSRQLGIWLIGGTVPLIAESITADALPDDENLEASEENSFPLPKCKRVYNTMLVFNPVGEMVSRYDKIHLFSLSHGKETYNESRTIAPGRDIRVAELPFGKVGLSVCYDLRFPELYRAMGRCNLLVAPSAFTYPTGEAHWKMLLQARAVENQAYVLAAAQGGIHENKRRTWGHSMLVDPWGRVIAEKETDGEGFIIGDIDTQEISSIRERLPALEHRVM